MEPGRAEGWSQSAYKWGMTLKEVAYTESTLLISSENLAEKSVVLHTSLDFVHLKIFFPMLHFVMYFCERLESASNFGISVSNYGMYGQGGRYSPPLKCTLSKLV